LNNNLVLVFEGEEETGSKHFYALASRAKELKKVDVFYMFDFGMEKRDQPEIFFGLRGLIAFELEVISGKKDLHSGVYGNRVLNPVNVLTELLAKIKNNEGKIIIPGFYEGIKPPTAKEMEYLIAKSQTDKELMEEAGVYKAATVDEKYPWLSTKIYPSFDINGIDGGYTGMGIKTVIAAQAKAKFSFRLVENQSPDDIEKKVAAFIKRNITPGVVYRLTSLGKLDPFHTNPSNVYIKKADDIFYRSFGNRARFARTGGSIGAAAILARLFHKPIVLTGFTLPDCDIHSPNENYDEKMFWKGIEVMENIFLQ